MNQGKGKKQKNMGKGYETLKKAKKTCYSVDKRLIVVYNIYFFIKMCYNTIIRSRQIRP